MACDAGAGQHPAALAGAGRGLLEFDLGQLDFLPHQGGHVPRDIAQEIAQGRRLGLRVRGGGGHFAGHRRPPSKGSSRKGSRSGPAGAGPSPRARRPSGPAGRRRRADRRRADWAGRCPRSPPSWFPGPASARAAAERPSRCRGPGWRWWPVAVVSGAPALRLRLSRPARTPAPAASSRKVPGRWRAKDFTSVSSEPGSRPSSQDATAEDRSAAWRTRSVATPGWSEAAAMLCSSVETERSPSATFCCCAPAWSVRSDLAWCRRSRAFVFTSAATLDGFGFGRLCDGLGGISGLALQFRGLVLGRVGLGCAGVGGGAGNAAVWNRRESGFRPEGSLLGGRGCAVATVLGPLVLCHLRSLSRSAADHEPAISGELNSKHDY